MRIDAHQHFWQYSPKEYPWIDDSMRTIKADFLPADLKPHLDAAGIDATIAVQAQTSTTETDWLLDLAVKSPQIIAGVVGWVDLCRPDVEKLLHSFAGTKLVGIRHVLQGEPDDRYMLRPDFMRGLRLLENFDLKYDLLIQPRHLPIACELVAQLPNQPFVLDHLAKPFIKDGILEPWQTHLRQLATFPNVYCKLSGMVTEADWSSWLPADFRPYLDTAMEAFGPSRLMFGSDWPVCQVAGSYAGVYAVVADYLDQLSAAEQDQIMGNTAATFYFDSI